MPPPSPPGPSQPRASRKKPPMTPSERASANRRSAVASRARARATAEASRKEKARLHENNAAARAQHAARTRPPSSSTGRLPPISSLHLPGVAGGSNHGFGHSSVPGPSTGGGSSSGSVPGSSPGSIPGSFSGSSFGSASGSFPGSASGSAAGPSSSRVANLPPPPPSFHGTTQLTPRMARLLAKNSLPKTGPGSAGAVLDKAIAGGSDVQGDPIWDVAGAKASKAAARRQERAPHPHDPRLSGAGAASSSTPSGSKPPLPPPPKPPPRRN